MRPFWVEISTSIKEKVEAWNVPVYIERAFYRELVDILERQSAFDILKHTERGHVLNFRVEVFTFNVLLQLHNETFEVIEIQQVLP